MQNKKEAFDYEALKKKTLEQSRSGKSLFSKGGAFAPLLKDFLEAALQVECMSIWTGGFRVKQPEKRLQ